MNENFESGAFSLPASVYRGLLMLYPTAFRRRYGQEMLSAFQEEWFAAQEKSAAHMVGYVAHLCWDVVRTVPQEWCSVLPRITVLAFLAAMLGLAYCSASSTPLLLKLIGCAAFTGLVGLRSVAMTGLRWLAQLRLMVLGVLAGLFLASVVNLGPRLVSAPQGPLREVEDAALTGPEIYRRMSAVYHEAQSYVDEGEVQTIFGGPTSRTTIKTFSTAYVRNGGFRFSFKDRFQRLDPWNEYTVWLDGATVRKWWAIKPETVVEKDLARALGGAAGISSNASMFVPSLLFPDSRIGMPAGNAQRWELLGGERIDGREVFKLRFDPGVGPTYFVWVDAQTYLITRIGSRDESRWVPRLTFDELVVYHPRLNVPVDASALVFHPEPQQSLFWRRWATGQNYLSLLGVGLMLTGTLLNFFHRRLLRGKGRRKSETWLGPLNHRRSFGYFGILASGVGLWLKGVELELIAANCLLACFMMQSGFELYVMHRRVRGYARLSSAM